MNTPSQPTPPRNRLIIPGAPAETPSEPEVQSTEHDPDEQEGGGELISETMEEQDAYIEDVEASGVPLDETIEYAEDEVYSEETMEGDEDEFLMVENQPVEEQDVEHSVQAEAHTESSASEPKAIRRLLPRGAVDDHTAPVPRRFSSFQTSAVSLGSDQYAHPEQQTDYQQTAPPQSDAHLVANLPPVHAAGQVAAGPAVNESSSATIQQQRAALARARSGLPSWIFSLIGFLFGVLTVLALVKLGVMPPALGITDQKSLREAVKEERARIIEVLETDGYDVEDWDNFVDE